MFFAMALLGHHTYHSFQSSFHFGKMKVSDHFRRALGDCFTREEPPTQSKWTTQPRAWCHVNNSFGGAKSPVFVVTSWQEDQKWNPPSYGCMAVLYKTANPLSDSRMAMIYNTVKPFALPYGCMTVILYTVQPTHLARSAVQDHYQ